MSILNLFIIIKSYVLNDKLVVENISFGSKDKKNRVMIFERESTNKLRKIKFNEFYEWINWRLMKDLGYNESRDLYCILISFNKNIINEKKIDLNLLKPKYPWNIDILNNIDYYDTLKDDKDFIIDDLKKKIEEIKNDKDCIIKELKKEIEELKKR